MDFSRLNDFTTNLGTGLKGFFVTLGTDVVSPIGALICGIMALIAIVKAISIHSTGGGGSQFWQMLFAAVLCFFGAIALGTIWGMFATYM